MNSPNEPPPSDPTPPDPSAPQPFQPPPADPQAAPIQQPPPAPPYQPPPPGYGYQQPGQAYPQQPAPYGYAPAPPTSGKATTALVLGICGFLVCPVICSVLAIIFGALAKKEIDESPGMQGRGQAQAGFILGIVSLVIGLIIIIAYAVLIIVALNADSGTTYHYNGTYS